MGGRDVFRIVRGGIFSPTIMRQRVWRSTFAFHLYHTRASITPRSRTAGHLVLFAYTYCDGRELIGNWLTLISVLFLKPLSLASAAAVAALSRQKVVPDTSPDGTRAPCATAMYRQMHCMLPVCITIPVSISSRSSLASQQVATPEQNTSINFWRALTNTRPIAFHAKTSWKQCPQTASFSKKFYRARSDRFDVKVIIKMAPL